jgi:hypothetical protein
MHVRFAFAAIALTIGSSAVADPPKNQLREATQPADRRPEVVLASAEDVRTPAPDAEQQSPTPPKRPRAARVTTCRCGDSPQN